jgi:hypothetical protein
MRTTTATSEKPVSLFKKAKNELSRIRKTILRELSRCKETGKLVGITSQALGEGTVLSSVEDIYRNGADEVVVVKWYDANNIASQTHLFIDEILAVRPIDKLKRNSLTSIQ